MKAELVSLARPVLPTPQSKSSPHDAPLSPDIIVIDSESLQVTPDNSTASVQDSHSVENIQDSHDQSSSYLTNQLPQLMHPTSQEH